MSFLPYIVAAWLFVVGLWGVVTAPNLVRAVISLTVVQGAVTRDLRAPDQCKLAGAKAVGTADWRLALTRGQFQLRVVAAHSSTWSRTRCRSSTCISWTRAVDVAGTTSASSA